MSRFIIAAALALAIALFVWFDLGSLLTLESLKAQQAGFAARYASDPLPIIAAFMLVYVAVTAASLPGAAILTLAAGALFGLVTGTIIVSFASTIGATLAFLVSRHLFRDWVAAKFGARMKAIDEGIARDGAFYLFSLRLVPAFPFFVINLLMGLTAIRTWTFYWVSQVGMFLGTIVYVNAGTQLARINSLRDIASPMLLLSFTALGLLPWAGKGVMAWLKRRRVYAPYRRPRRFDRNLVVIGAGAAGLVSSYIAATVRAKVTLVEQHKMGGDCLNFGCVPSKAIIKSARVATTLRTAGKYGLVAEAPRVDFRAVMQRVRDVITAIEPHDSVERYTGLGVDVAQGHARIIDPWTVAIRDADGREEQLTTRSIVIAAGAAPAVPDLPGLAESGYVTSDTLWDRFGDQDSPPAELVVLGGGPIGCELAAAFAALGSRVTLVELAPRLLLREDDEVSAAAREALEAVGVDVRLGTRALRCEGGTGTKRLVVDAGAGEMALPFTDLLVAVGRKARLTGYGLEELGVDTERTVPTDAYLATLYPNIFAAGDVAGPYQLTHVASHQAWFATVNALFGQFKRFKADYRVIPAVTFLQPEIARVGLNEREAAEQGVAVDVTRYALDDLDRAIADGTTSGFVKILTAPGKDQILGVTIVGENAGELIAEYVLAMKYGIGVNKMLGTIHSYPTMAEANKFVAGQWKQARKPERLLALVERYHRWRRG